MSKEPTEINVDLKMRQFFHQLINISQYRSGRLFMSGSMREAELTSSTVKALDINLSDIDADFMIYRSDQYAFSSTTPLPHWYKSQKVIRYYSEHRHPGYVVLIDDVTGQLFNFASVRASARALDPKSFDHGPAIQLNDTVEDHIQTLTDHGMVFDNLAFDYSVSQQDAVFSVHNPFWPNEADEWITRKRPHECPSKSVIKRVKEYGCDFVQIAHKFSDQKEKEWRFSFSMAELIIINNWTSEQRIVFRVLRVLLKMKGSQLKTDCMCSFYMKTLMLWACEENSADFWKDDCLVNSVQVLLNRFISYLQARNLPNYFIRTNNIIDHLDDIQVRNVITGVYKTVQQPLLIDRVIHQCRNEESFCNSRVQQVELPTWINRSLIIFDRLCNVSDNFKDIFSYHCSAVLQSALLEEIADIYEAVRLQQEASRCGTMMAKRRCWTSAEKHLLIATSHCESTKRTFSKLNFDRDLLTLYFCLCAENIYATSELEQNEIQLGFSSCLDAHLEHLEADPNDTLKCEYIQADSDQSPKLKQLVYHRTGVLNNMKTTKTKKEAVQSSSVPLKIIKFTKHFEKVIDENAVRIQYFSGHPINTPTVNISWFTAKAYIANLHYNTRYDNHNAVIHTCNEIIQTYHKCNGNKKFAEDALPVILTTDWSQIYDNEIRVLLGFVSMCSFINADKQMIQNPVFLGVCPVEFACYLKARCLIEQALTEFLNNTNRRSSFVICRDKIVLAIETYTDHVRVCKSDRYIKNQGSILSVALELAVKSVIDILNVDVQ